MPLKLISPRQTLNSHIKKWKRGCNFRVLISEFSITFHSLLFRSSEWKCWKGSCWKVISRTSSNKCVIFSEIFSWSRFQSLCCCCRLISCDTSRHGLFITAGNNRGDLKNISIEQKYFVFKTSSSLNRLLKAVFTWLLIRKLHAFTAHPAFYYIERILFDLAWQ